MSELKMVYIDLYMPIFTNDGVTIREVKHLKKLDIYTDINVQEIVFTLRELIFKRYGDGLHIKAEEFDSFTYLNVYIYFGEDVSTLIDYLDSISKDIPEVVKKEIHNLNEVDQEVSFLSIGWADSEEIKEYELTINSSGFELNNYLVGQSAFERGAGDYHQFFILIISALATGALNEIGKRSLDNIMSMFENKERTSIVEFNPKIVIDYVSSTSGVNSRDLRITRISPIDEKSIQISVSSRYKKFNLKYDNTSKSIISYEEIDKNKTMI